jgi:putative ABC transport system substrate-binding protein
LGYQEGLNVHCEVLYGEGSIDKFEQCAREHVSAKVDLIWASGTPAASAAQRATASIPVVFALVGDPVYSKLVRSIAAPGANLTGMSLMISEMWEKRIEILTEIFPTDRRAKLDHVKWSVHRSSQGRAGCETTLTPPNLTPANPISCTRSWHVGIECNSIG